MTEPLPQLQPMTARKIVVWQMIFFAFLFALATVDNVFTVIADNARHGHVLPVWEPSVWEISSNLVQWALVPGVAGWLGRFPLVRERWQRNLPAHLLAVVVYSVTHTASMILLRKLSYRLMDTQYDFGPLWTNWVYELRKDALTYGLIVGGLMAFRTYGLWLDSQGHRPDGLAPGAWPARGAMVPADAATPDEIPPSIQLPLGRLLVRKRNREFILDAGDIDRIDADGNYVVVHAGGESYRLRDSLEGLGKRLGEKRFARVHRAHVVNIDRIREIQPWDHGDYRILLKDGSFVNFSRRYRSRLHHLLQ